MKQNNILNRDKYRVYTYCYKVARDNNIKHHDRLFMILLLMLPLICLILAIISVYFSLGFSECMIGLGLFMIYVIGIMIMYAVSCQRGAKIEASAYVFENNGDIWKVFKSDELPTALKKNNFADLLAMENRTFVKEIIFYVEGAKVGYDYWDIWFGGVKVTRYLRPTFIKEDKKYYYYRTYNGKEFKIEKAYALAY